MPDTLFLNNGHRAGIRFLMLLLLKQRTLGFVLSFVCRMRKKATHKSLIGYCQPAGWNDFLSICVAVVD